MNIIGDYEAHKRDEAFDRAEDRRLARKAALVVHYGSTRGALCGTPSGNLTLSTSDEMVDCPACRELFCPVCGFPVGHSIGCSTGPKEVKP